MDETVYGMGKEETKTRTQEQDSGESRGKAKPVSTSDSGAKVEMRGNLGKSEEEGQKENEFERVVTTKVSRNIMHGVQFICWSAACLACISPGSLSQH